MDKQSDNQSFIRGVFANRNKLLMKVLLAVGLWVFAFGFFVLSKDTFYALDLHGNPSLLKKKVVIYFACFLIYSVCIFIKNNLSEHTNRMINLHIMEWFPLICFVMVETACHGELHNIKLKRFILNVLIYMVIMYLVYAITASIRASMISLAVFSALFATINIYLMEFRQIPFMAADISDWKTAANVAGDFSFKINSDILMLILFVVAVIIISTKVVSGKYTVKGRVVLGTTYACFLGTMLYLTIFSNFLLSMDVTINTFRPSRSYSLNGNLLAFTKSINLMIVEKPEGYNEKKLAEITNAYPSDSVSDTEAVRPNVIVIMNEAFCDLQSVGTFETNQEVLPFYNSLEENTVKGYAYVSSFGGKTANSEFEFLSGDSMAFFTDAVTPYQLYVKDYLPTLTGNLKNDNYAGVLAMHPFKASGYNRENAYELMGFNDFISVEDIDLNQVKLVRDFMSDESDVERIIEEYEKVRKESKEPFYFFNVTMQNHSPYDTSFDNLPMDVEITTPECKDIEAERYLNLAHLSDAAAQKLVAYFEKQEEPTIIVMFGDHEPGLSNSFYQKIMGKSVNSLEGLEAMERYKVPFFIWANYDIEEKYIQGTSLNYLQSVMLDVAGMKKSGYNKYQLDMMQEIPIFNAAGYVGKDGNYYETTDKYSPYYDKVVEYHKLEYNHLFGDERQDSFFELSK